MRVNGIKTGANCPLHPHDEVAYYLTKAEESRASHLPVYSDDHVLVVDKESGVSAEALFQELSEGQPLYFVHRLDRNTEGVMIFARDQAAYDELLRCFKTRHVRKEYEALVFGTPPAHAICSAYLEKDADAATVSVNEQGRGEKIVTEYFLSEQRGDMTLLRVLLHTGKTHQIRAHLAYLHLPIVGDEKYGDHVRNKAAHCTRQRLLAKDLSFSFDGALSYLNGTHFISSRKL